MLVVKNSTYLFHGGGCGVPVVNLVDKPPVEEDEERPGDYQVDYVLGNPVSFGRVISDLPGEGPLRNALVPHQTETNVKTKVKIQSR